MADIILWLVLAILEKNRPARYGMVGLMAGIVTIMGYSVFTALLSAQFSGGVQDHQSLFTLCSFPAGFFGLLGGLLGGFVGDKKFASLRHGKYIFAWLGGMITSSVIVIILTF